MAAKPPKSRPRGGGRQPAPINLFNLPTRLVPVPGSYDVVTERPTIPVPSLAPPPPFTAKEGRTATKETARVRALPRSTKEAIAYSGKRQLTPADLPKEPPVPGSGIYRRGYKPPPTPSNLNAQVDLTRQMAFDPSARPVLATTLTPKEKEALRTQGNVDYKAAHEQWLAEHPPPHRVVTGVPYSRDVLPKQLPQRAVLAPPPPGGGVDYFNLLRQAGRIGEGYLKDIGRGRTPGLAEVQDVGKEIGRQTAPWLVHTAAPAIERTAASIAAGMAPSPIVQGTTAPPSEAGIVPAVVPEGIAKLATATAAAVPGLVAHPLRTIDEAAAMARGTGQLAVMAGMLANPTITPQQKTSLINDLKTGTLDYIASHYGPNVTWRQALKQGWAQPFSTIMDALTVAAPGAEAVTVYRLMKGGATFGEARMLARDPARIEEFPHVTTPYKPRVVTVRQQHGKDFQVTMTPVRSPLGRAFVRGADIATGAVERAAGRRVGPMIPLTPTRRGLKQATQLGRRENARLVAQGHALYRQVADYVHKTLGITDTTEAGRLYYAHQKPADIPDEVWFRALADSTQRLLDEGVQSTGRPMTATERQLASRLARFKAMGDRVAHERWSQKVQDVHAEKLRLHHSLGALNDDLRVTRERLRAAETGDTSILDENIMRLRNERDAATDPHVRAGVEVRLNRLEAERTPLYDELSRGRRIEAVKQDEKTLLDRRTALGQQLDDLSVAEEPIVAPGRDRLEAALNDTPKLDEEQRARLLQLEDTVARVWARRNLAEPAAYYSSPDFIAEFRRLEDVGQLPEGALTQKLSAPAMNANRLDPQGIYPRTESGRLYYNAEHKPYVDALDQAEAEHAAMKKLHPKKDEEGNYHPDRVAAKEKLDKAREEELFQRVMHGSTAYKGQVPDIPARASLAKRLVSTYRKRTGALPAAGQTRRQLERTMALLDELATKGKAGRMWYENSAKAILQLAGGDKKLAARIAQLVAIYSPQKAVIPNLGEAIKAYNSWLKNMPIENGQDWQKAAVVRVLSGKGEWAGRKTNNFYLNFLEDIDKRAYNREVKLTPEEEKALKAKGVGNIKDHQIGGVTADMWMARVFGYLKTGVSEGRYDVIESVVKQLAKERGWKPKQVQAAIWTAIKDISDDVSANVDFADAIARHHGIVNYETAPGSSYAGAFKDIYNGWDGETQQAFLEATSRPIDQFLADAGILHRTSEFGTGVYEGVAAPGARVRLVAAREKNIDYAISAHERALFDYVAASIGRATLQNSVPWARGFIPKAFSHADTVLVPLGRRATDEEAMRLYEMLNPKGERERVFVVHAGGEGVLLRRNHDIPVNEWANHAVGKAKFAESFQGQAKTAIEAVFPKQEEHTLMVSDGNLLVNDWSTGGEDYTRAIEAALGDTGGSEQGLRLRQLADRLQRDTAAVRDEFAADPAAAVDRHASLAGQRSAARESRGAADARPVATLAQTRNADILGAVHFLTDTSEGSRILYYSQHADVSTWLHELYGHAVREIKAADPRGFQPVEDMIGKPLEEWNVADHERFARMAEAYFMSGKAPTPELVDTFRQLKQWMRAIYGAEQRLGVQLHPAVRDVFDTLFGSYEDQNVYRIASQMTKPGTAMRGGEARALREFTDQELAVLRKRNDAAAFRRSAEGLQKSIEDQTAAMNEAGGWDAATPEAQEKLRETTIAWAKVESSRQVAEIDRETGLRNRLSMLEDILAKPAGPGYEGALNALGELMQQREDILREAFGDDFMDNRANRVDLLADFLVDAKLLPEDFARGTARYAPHEQFGYGQRPRMLARPGQALTGNVVGQVDTKLLNLYSRNHLIRWQNGDLTADPKVILDAWQNATAYAFATRWKNAMDAVGRPLLKNEVVPDDATLVNVKGTPISGLHKRPPSQATTAEAQAAMDGIAGRDLNAIEQSVHGYLSNVFLDGKQLNEFLAAHPDMPVSALGLKIIDKRVMEAMTRPLRGSRSNRFWKLSEALNTIARMSLIYTNPAYVPVNLFGNMLFLTATEGPQGIANLVSAARMLHGDKAHADRVAAEAGELPVQATIEHGRGAGAWARYGRKIEQRYIHGLTYIPDRWPRIAAWVTEAQRLGYRTKADQVRLIEGKTAKAARDREIVADRTNNAMVNFSLAGDAEKMFAGRLLFIWPWIRGATAWPFYYAREFPFATGALGVPGRVMEERRQRLMGSNIPPAQRDLVPLGPGAGKATEAVFNAAPFSPGGTAASSIEALVNIIEGIVQGHRPQIGLRAGDYGAPALDLVNELVTGFDQFGRKISYRDALLDFGMNTIVPSGATFQALIDPSHASKAYRSRTRLDIAARKWLRFTPQDVSLVTLHAFQKGDPKTTLQKVNDTMTSLTTRANKLGGDPPDNAVRYAIQIQQAYEDRRKIEKDKIRQKGVWYPTKEGQTEPQLTGRQDYAIALALFAKHRGADLAAGFTPPDQLTDAEAETLAHAILYGSARAGIPREDALLAPLLDYQRDLNKAEK